MNNGTLVLSISLIGKERKRLRYTSYKYMLIFSCGYVCFSKLYETEQYMYFFFQNTKWMKSVIATHKQFIERFELGVLKSEDRPTKRLFQPKISPHHIDTHNRISHHNHERILFTENLRNLSVETR